MDALACTADEGRDTLRKAMGSCEYAMIHRYPNGETHLRYLEIQLSRMALDFTVFAFGLN